MKFLILIVLLFSCTKNKLTLKKIVNEEIALELTLDHVWYEKNELFIKEGLKSPFGKKNAVLAIKERIQKDYDDGKLLATSDVAIAQTLGEKIFVRVGLLQIASKNLKRDRIGFAASEGASKRICVKLLQLLKEEYKFKTEDESELKILYVFYNDYAEQIKDAFFEAAITARTIRDELKVGGNLENVKPACEYFTSIR